MRFSHLVLMGMIFLLSACGGSPGTAPLPGLNDARILPYEHVQSAASQLATSDSRTTSTGSVRSSSPDDTVSTHIERTDPTAPDIRLTVTRSNANPLSLDSRQHSFTDTIEKRPLPPSPLRRHHLREWTLFDYTKESTSAATVTVSWHNEDPTDYLAGGYWMHLRGDLATDAITAVDLGAFIDGPEFAGTPTLPVMGTATYRDVPPACIRIYMDPCGRPLIRVSPTDSRRPGNTPLRSR